MVDTEQDQQLEMIRVLHRQAEDLLEEKRQELQELETEIEDLRRELDGYVRGLRRLGATPNEDKPATTGWAALNRSEAVERLLAEQTEPVPPRQLADLLRERGRDDEPKDVSSSLAYLKRQNKATNTEDGWILIKDNDASEDAADG